MKLPAKGVPSPTRADNAPLTLLSFLGNNGGSRSRGRCRSSPSLIRKNSNNQVSMVQEPSSPKVTCIGKVQVRTSKETVSKTDVEKTRNRCEWVRNILFFRCSGRISDSKMSKQVWGKWCSFLRWRKRESSDGEGKAEEKEVDGERPKEVRKERVEDVDPSTPPKDALLLMKCRSEPFRRSWRGSRFLDLEAVKNQREDGHPILEKS